MNPDTDISCARFESSRVDSGEGFHHIRIMTGQRARDGDVIEPLGMDTSEYERNPVVLWIHDRIGLTPSAGLPIARTRSLTRNADCIAAGFEFLQGDPFADRVRNAWNQGFINTASIGWRTYQWEPMAAGGRRHTRSSLLEWSLAPVPIDPGASRSDDHSRALVELGLEPLPSNRRTWTNSHGTFSIDSRFLHHDDCRFSWDAMSRAAGPMDERCPVCHAHESGRGTVGLREAVKGLRAGLDSLRSQGALEDRTRGRRAQNADTAIQARGPEGPTTHQQQRRRE